MLILNKSPVNKNYKFFFKVKSTSHRTKNALKYIHCRIHQKWMRQMCISPCIFLYCEQNLCFAVQVRLFTCTTRFPASLHFWTINWNTKDPAPNYSRTNWSVVMYTLSTFELLMTFFHSTPTNQKSYKQWRLLFTSRIKHCGLLQKYKCLTLG
jgi:hypothetical protein